MLASLIVRVRAAASVRVTPVGSTGRSVAPGRRASVARPTIGSGPAGAILALQTLAGNRAVTRMLQSGGLTAGQDRRGGAVTVQRAGTHFHGFLKKNVPSLSPSTSPSDKQAAVFAWMLDQNIYELAEFLAGELAETSMSTVSLGHYGITLRDVTSIATQSGAPGPSVGRMEHLRWLHEFIQQVPSMLTTSISQHAATQGKKRTSMVKWRGLTTWGSGLGGELIMGPGGIQAGSSAGGDPVWMKTVEQHVPPGGGTTLYVRGHLLNYDLGGPGLDYNMVPITGKPAKNVGANDANGEHFHKAEAAAKDVLKRVQSGQYEEGYYSVVPTYNRTARAATNDVVVQATKLRSLLTAYQTHVAGQHHTQGDAHVTHRFSQMHQVSGVPIPNPLPPPTDQLAAVTMADVRSVVGETLGALRAAAHPLAGEIDKNMDRGILDASTSNETDSQTVADLLALLEGNAEAWQVEDTVIPTDLTVELKWTPASGPNKGAPQSKAIAPIPVTLATSASGVWYRPKKPSEDA